MVAAQEKVTDDPADSEVVWEKIELVGVVVVLMAQGKVDLVAV